MYDQVNVDMHAFFSFVSGQSQWLYACGGGEYIAKHRKVSVWMSVMLQITMHHWVHCVGPWMLEVFVHPCGKLHYQFNNNSMYACVYACMQARACVWFRKKKRRYLPALNMLVFLSAFCGREANWWISIPIALWWATRSKKKKTQDSRNFRNLLFPQWLC